MALGLLAHETPEVFFSRILRSEALAVHIFFRTAVLRKLFHIRFSYKHCNFSRICLLVKMASKTVTRSIAKHCPFWTNKACQRITFTIFALPIIHLVYPLQILQKNCLNFLGMIVMRRRNWKQWLCKILFGEAYAPFTQTTLVGWVYYGQCEISKIGADGHRNPT